MTTEQGGYAMPALASLFALGLLFAALIWRTGSIWRAVVAHGMYVQCLRLRLFALVRHAALTGSTRSPLALDGHDDEPQLALGGLQDLLRRSNAVLNLHTERHVLYVACTRARDQLLITGVDPDSEFHDDLLD